MKVLGFVMMVIGLIGMLYGGLSWTRRDTVVDAGPIEITADKRERVVIPPLVGGIVFVAGVALLLKATAR
jgi:hypothetical protein